MLRGTVRYSKPDWEQARAFNKQDRHQLARFLQVHRLLLTLGMSITSSPKAAWLRSRTITPTQSKSHLINQHNNTSNFLIISFSQITSRDLKYPLHTLNKTLQAYNPQSQLH